MVKIEAIKIPSWPESQILGFLLEMDLTMLINRTFCVEQKKDGACEMTSSKEKDEIGILRFKDGLLWVYGKPQAAAIIATLICDTSVDFEMETLEFPSLPDAWEMFDQAR